MEANGAQCLSNVVPVNMNSGFRVCYLPSTKSDYSRKKLTAYNSVKWHLASKNPPLEFQLGSPHQYEPKQVKIRPTYEESSDCNKSNSPDSLGNYVYPSKERFR